MPGRLGLEFSLESSGTVLRARFALVSTTAASKRTSATPPATGAAMTTAGTCAGPPPPDASVTPATAAGAKPGGLEARTAWPGPSAGAAAGAKSAALAPGACATAAL